jgi:hypothetical protein
MSSDMRWIAYARTSLSVIYVFIFVLMPRVSFHSDLVVAVDDELNLPNRVSLWISSDLDVLMLNSMSSGFLFHLI